MSFVANNVERIRTSHALTQEQLAAILGVSRATYISVTKGKRDLTTGELEKLSAFFNVPIAEFFDQPRNN
ncbi:MAG: helix-turn-helix domain-containing protein, partial [Oscillospiraceae bacterium]|nr:helix-turn-helix domain-containing protein [Oscillospiraceae bacterium]